MTDEQARALAEAARVGALVDSEVEAVIDRHHKKEREFILRYVERTVCGFDTTGHVITGQQKIADPEPTQAPPPPPIR